MKLRILVVPVLLSLAACGSKKEPAPAAPAKTEPAKTEPAKTEPVKAEAADAEAAKPTEAADAEAAKATEPAKVEAADAEAAKPAEAEVAPIPEPKGLFACAAKPDFAAPARDAKNPWALPWDVTACPTIPSVFGKLAFGMDRAAAAAAAPEAKVEDGASSGYIYLGKHPFRLQLAFWFSEAGKLERFTHRIDASAFDVLKAAWGEPATFEDGGEKSFRWYNAEAKIMVTAEVDDWERANATTKEDETVPGYKLFWREYQPLAGVLGADGLVSKGLLGKTVAELEAMLPGLVEKESAEDAKKNLAAAGLDPSTQAKAEALGAASASVALNLPPTESNEHFTRVHLDFDGDKVKSYSFSLDHEKQQPIADEVLAQIGALLGKPTAAKKGDDGVEYTFAGPGGTKVVVKPTILADGWDVEVSAP